MGKTSKALEDILNTSKVGEGIGEAEKLSEVRKTIENTTNVGNNIAEEAAKVPKVADEVETSKINNGREVSKGAADPKKVKYYRVQSEGKSGSFERLKVNEDGTISVLTDNSNMNLSAVTDEHAQYFLNEVRKGEGYIIEFEVDDWFHEMVMENAIPQAGYRKSVLNQGKTAPKIVDPTKPRPNATSISFEFPPIWNDFFEEVAHNAKILKN